MKRRELLHNTICSALGGVGLYSALGNLKLVEAAVRGYGAEAFDDYKALVCVFLYGGNDALNTVIPRDATHYNQYAAARATLALPQDGLLPLTPQSGGEPSDGASYGLQPATSTDDPVGVAGLQGLFNDGHAAIVGNVGTMIQPVTKEDYRAGRVRVPPQLFSHNDQQEYWQVSRTDDSRNLGWGGRIADLLYDANPGATIPMTVSLGHESVLERAASTNQYVMGTDGPRHFGPFEWDDDRRRAFLAMMAPGTQAHVLERSFASIFHRSRDNANALAVALEGAPALGTVFPPTYLGAQMKMVARLISVRGALNLKRQIFFVSIGGFDNHDYLLQDHPGLLSQVSQAITALYDATGELGVSSSVTTFTASDFGRTLSSNGDGSDHGWGAHHFAVGGAVRGGRFYGTMPVLQNDGPDDVGWGQIIPTTSVDQYAATLARWFGVADSDLGTIFPNVGNFASRNLGFMV